MIKQARETELYEEHRVDFSDEESEVQTNLGKRLFIPQDFLHSIFPIIFDPEGFEAEDGTNIAGPFQKNTRVIGTGFFCGPYGMFISAAHVLHEEDLEEWLEDRTIAAACLLPGGRYRTFLIDAVGVDARKDLAIGLLGIERKQRGKTLPLPCLQVSATPPESKILNGTFATMGYQGTDYYKDQEGVAHIDCSPIFFVGSGAEISAGRRGFIRGEGRLEFDGPFLKVPLKSRGGLSGSPLISLQRSPESDIHKCVVYGVASGNDQVRSEEIYSSYFSMIGGEDFEFNFYGIGSGLKRLIGLLNLLFQEHD